MGMIEPTASTTVPRRVDGGPTAVDVGEIGPWASVSGEVTCTWLAWDKAALHVTVRCDFQGDLPRETDAVELYSVDARCEDSLIRVAVNAAGAVLVMGGGQIVQQPKWGYWHHKALEIGVDVRVVYLSGAWQAQMAIPFAGLGIAVTPGAVVAINLCRCEHRRAFGYPNCGCALGVRRSYWPLSPAFDPHLPLFYPRLTLSGAAVGITPSATKPQPLVAPAPSATAPAPLAFRGLMLDQSRGALKFSDAYLCRLATRLKAWGVDRFMIYTEGEFAPAAYPMLRRDDTYDATSLRQLGGDLADAGVELVPCHATLGHLDRVLATPELAHLREAGQSYQICLSQPESYDFLGAVIDEMCAATSGTLFHANTDESVMLGMCETCRDAMARAGGYGPWLLKHLLWLRQRVGRHGRRLLIWADMVLRLPSVLAALPRDVVLADWEYEDFGTYPALACLKAKGFEVLACPWLNLANHRTYSRAARQAGADGFLQTCWTRGNKSLGEAWPAFYHSARRFGQADGADAVALWIDMERELGATGFAPPLPWEHLAFAIDEGDTFSPAVKYAYCRAFLDGWSRFDEGGPWEDVLHELRRDLLLQAWRLALAGHGGPAPSVAEVEALAAAEAAFRREAVHATATSQDPRLTELLAQMAKHAGSATIDQEA